MASLSSTALSKHPMFSQFSQLSQQIEDRKPYIYFVLPPGKTAEECKKTNLGEMFVAAQAHFLNVMWVTDDECNTLEMQEDGNVFVFDPFGSSGFNYLVGKLSSTPRVEILSPTVLRQVLIDPQQNTFETKDSPVYTLAMKGMIICLSGFKDKAVKDELEQLVRWMNGSLSPSLTKAVTHVVTTTAYTPKCIEANKEDIPVMMEDWVKKVFEDNKEIPVSASDSRYVKYLCPVFYNVNICMSQISVVKKNALKQGIESHGGQVFSELVKKQTDILVVQNSSGDKYKFAQRWNVKCVTPQWVENSIEKGRILPPADYQVSSNSSEFVAPNLETGPITSTPAHSIMPDWNMTRCSAIIDDERDRVEASKANFTRIHDETMSQLRAIPDNGPFLDGCKIYVVEYEKSDELKRRLNKSGAVRMNRLCEGVTHVIVAGANAKLPKAIQNQIKDLESTPYVVTFEWVVQSAKDGSPADEEAFKYDHIDTICQETHNGPTNLNMSSRIARVSATALEIYPSEAISNGIGKRQSPPAGTKVSSTNSTKSSGSKIAGIKGSSSKSSSGGSTRETITKLSTGARSNNTSSGSKSSNSTKRSEDSDSDDSDVTQESNTTSNTNQDSEDTSQGLLVGITFKVVLRNTQDSDYVKEMVIENGGRVVEKNADVAIFDPVCDPIEKDRADQAFTKYWLFDCLDSSALDIENVFTHNTMPSFEGMKEILTGVVVAVSQYNPAEREYILEVVKSLGAKCQDVFARKDSADGRNMRSTHLICKNMDNDKAKAARRWNVPVVVAEWLTDSFKERKRLDEDRYDPAQASTSDERTVFMPTPQRRKTINANNLNNMSVRSIYPPSTQKGAPSTKFTKKSNAEDAAMNDLKSHVPPPEPQPTSSKAAQPTSSKDGHRTPPKVPIQSLKQADNDDINDKPSSTVEIPTKDKASKDDNGLRNRPVSSTEKELLQKMAEAKAQFPYSDESFERMLEDVKAKGVNLEDISPFSSFEERRLCNPNPDSPLVLGLPRHESKALKEQFEIAMNMTPNFNKVKMKTPPSTPMYEIQRRFHEIQDRMGRMDQDSPSSSPRISSTPKPNLRKVAAFNRLSHGNVTLNSSRNEVKDVPMDHLAGIRKLGNKRPSDGSPEEEDAKSSKRARPSSSEDSDVEDMAPKASTSPNENNEPKLETDNERPTSSKKTNHIKALVDLIAESQPDPNCKETKESPIKRRSADNRMLVPPDEVREEIEQPHIGWGEEGSTVKKVNPKSRIDQVQTDKNVPAPDTTDDVPKEEGRKRSSRLRKASSTVTVDDGGGGRVTRQTRARSRSKSRVEDNVPLGHQPMKTSEGRKGRKKKACTFPIELPENPIFGLSSLDQNERRDATQIISSLGGSLSKLATFDLNSHALITTKLLRSEKILGCIASGKFILKKEYLTKSQEAGQFLPITEEFLWLESNVTEDKERELARASFGWLKAQMENKGRQPMTGMRFCIVDQSPEKMKAFGRLIEAGGGEVVSNMKDATCIIKDEKSITVVPDGLQVQNALYLNTLILTIPSS